MQFANFSHLSLLYTRRLRRCVEWKPRLARRKAETVFVHEMTCTITAKEEEEEEEVVQFFQGLSPPPLSMMQPLIADQRIE